MFFYVSCDLLEYVLLEHQLVYDFQVAVLDLKEKLAGWIFRTPSQQKALCERQALRKIKRRDISAGRLFLFTATLPDCSECVEKPRSDASYYVYFCG